MMAKIKQRKRVWIRFSNRRRNKKRNREAKDLQNMIVYQISAYLGQKKII